MKCSVALIFAFGIVNQLFAQIDYPKTFKKPVVSNYHGFEIADDYIWLESQENDSVVRWINNQNKISEKYLKRLVAQHHTDEYMNKYLYSSFGDFDGKLKRNIDDEYFFKYFVTSGSTTPSLFYKKGVHSRYYILVNSTSISRKDKIDIDYYKISKNNTWLAYKYNRNGSDWHEIRVVKIDKKRHYLNVLKHTKHARIFWWNDGFFYEKYPFDSINATYKNPTIMYHKVDTKQEEDQIMFKSYSDDEVISVVGTKNESFYMVKRENTKTEIYNYYLFNPLRKNPKLGFSPFLINTKYNLNFYKATDSLLYATTEINDKQQLISIDKEEPTKFKLISPSYENYELQNYELLEDFIVASYHSFNGSFLVKFDYQGKVLNECVLPKGLSVTDMNYSNNFEAFFFYLSSYTIPEVRYKLNLETFKYELVSETNVNFDFKNYKFKQDYYSSSDGTKVPIFIVYKDTLKQDKSTPFLLKTYGGYGLTNIPSYNPGIIYFIENGGAFAYAHIRGSGGFGKKWVTDGQRLNKKNGIADFISAAEYLIDNNYTAPKKIAITGGSHGGLITGAALTQRPDLFGSAVINVGVLDMFRFENFTVGAAATNINEFGSTKNIEDFNNMLSFSPYHNINSSINYPSILLVTGADDNRVPPFHSYKFAAKLQSSNSQKNPVLLWTKDKTGHSGANTKSSLKEQYNYIYSFLFYQLQ